MKKTIAALSMLLMMASSIAASGQTEDTIHLSDGGDTLIINTSTLAMEIKSAAGEVYKVSDKAGNFTSRIENRTEKSVDLRLEDQGLLFSIVQEGKSLSFSFKAEKKSRINWPVYRGDAKDNLIFLKGDGQYIPFDDTEWLDYMQGEHDLISSPLWGWGNIEGTTAWITGTPFRSYLQLQDRTLTVEQNFLARRGTEEHLFSFTYEKNENPLLPAQCYRNYLISTGKFISYEEKTADLPEDMQDSLAGAVHMYLWGTQPLTSADIKNGAFISLAGEICNGSDMGKKIMNFMDNESLSSLQEMAETDWPNKYIKQQMARGLSDAIEVIGIEPFYDAYSSYLNPPETWGQGVSEAFIKELADAGIDKARLTLDGFYDSESVYAAAKAAGERGYLFGIYDSYHSIHPSSLLGTDDTWQTAQFPEGLYETGSIMKEDGTYFSGFKGVGRYLNPVIAKEAFQSRVSQNLEELPLSFYFIDCDAAGEYYEDYNPLHPTTSEESQEARMMRLRWLRKEKKLAIGSEGGDPFTLPEILVSEGAFAPAFSWEDPDFSDKDSDYYIGSYWPPEAPAGFFKETSLKDYLVKRYYDPYTRIPLLETIFHDSVAITNQWGSGMYKFKEGTKVLELLEMLYLNPPLYNMNRERLKEKKEELIHNYRFFSPLHEEYGFEELLSFQWLTEDRLIQKTSYEKGLTMVVNFSDTPFIYSDCELEPYSAAAYINDEYYGSFTPFDE